MTEATERLRPQDLDLPVEFEERDTAGGLRIGFARLNRPRQLNALDLRMCELLLARLREWASDEAIACVVLEGNGDKGFCAGGDVASVVREIRAGGARRFVLGDSFFAVEYQLDALIHAYPKPLVSWAHGVTMGGGVGLAVGASHRIVSEKLRLAMPEIHIGLFPDVGGGWFLNRVPGNAGLLMALTGLIVDATDAVFAGLADWRMPEAARAATWEALCALDWSGDARDDRARLTVLLARLAAEAAGTAHVSGTAHVAGMAGTAPPASALAARIDAIRAACAQPDVSAVRDALLALAERDDWFRVPAANLANGSPTAAHVTFEYMRRTRLLSLEQTLALDLVVARACQRHHDFPEGVRALLIDKDRAPRWSPARFEDVPRELVDAHFVPTPA